MRIKSRRKFVEAVSQDVSIVQKKIRIWNSVVHLRDALFHRLSLLLFLLFLSFLYLCFDEEGEGAQGKAGHDANPDIPAGGDKIPRGIGGCGSGGGGGDGGGDGGGARGTRDKYSYLDCSRHFASVEEEKMSEVYETQYAVASTKQGQEQGRAFLYHLLLVHVIADIDQIVLSQPNLVHLGRYS